MTLTEEEAKTRWCPFGRVVRSHSVDGHDKVFNGQPAFNRTETGIAGEVGVPLASRCIASSCMAWRWDYVSHGLNGMIKDKTIGYCGLAGQP